MSMDHLELGMMNGSKEDDRAIATNVMILMIIVSVVAMDTVIYFVASNVTGESDGTPEGVISLESASNDVVIQVNIESMDEGFTFADLNIEIYDGSGDVMAEGTDVTYEYEDSDDDGSISSGDYYSITRVDKCFSEYGEYTVYLIFVETGGTIDSASITI